MNNIVLNHEFYYEFLLDRLEICQKEVSYSDYLQFANRLDRICKTPLKGIKEVINLLKIMFSFLSFTKRNRKK